MHTRTLVTALALFVFTPHTHAETPGPSLPAEDARPRATRQQAIDAFTKDCHATLKTTAWVHEEELRVAECLALDVYQNCNPDTFGCYAALESCQERCKPVCTRCQDTCATSCDDCKSACAPDDRACVRACAEGRADCRDRCLNGLGQCQDKDCQSADNACVAAGIQRLRACDPALCDAWVECYDAQDDYDKAETVCQDKLAGYDDFCRNVCRSEHQIPTYYFQDGFVAQATTPDSGTALAARCTAEAQCPPDYAEVVPYLEAFCRGAITDASLDALGAAVTRGTIARRTLSLVFNAYGAMHGYQFKKETWMNGFFYGAGSPWLPGACRDRIKTVASAKVMPLRFTKLRDRVKKIWDGAR